VPISSLTARGASQKVRASASQRNETARRLRAANVVHARALPHPLRRNRSLGNDSCAREKLMSDDLIHREIKYFRDFSVVYTDAIRSSDFKANIALLFLPLLMVPILSAHERGLAHIPLWMILAPFLTAYFFSSWRYFPDTSDRKKALFICRGRQVLITSPLRTRRLPSWRRSSTGSHCCPVFYGGKRYT
jgi:hypothetical protein